MQDKIIISPYSKVKIYWDDRVENYSQANKRLIQNTIATRYGVSKNNVSVIYRPVKKNEKGEIVEITGASVENIMDVNYQRSLMKEWLQRENRQVDFERLMKLDDKVNTELNIDVTPHRSWSIRWITINNFLSFGESNYIPFNKIKGLTVVNSIPENTGGKTTLTIDSLKFLLHGTTTKTDKNEDIFNTYSGKNEVVVRGMIVIEDEEIIIERKMNRTLKKVGGYTIKNKVNYYKILPDGSEESQNKEDATKTTKKISETIGSEKDFEMLVLATEKSLDDLIGLTTTESGRFLTRLIGLEVIEQKEVIVRVMFNEFDKKKKSNDFDVVTLSNDIEEHTEKIALGVYAEIDLIKKLSSTKEEIQDLRKENDRLLESKIKIDTTITTLNPTKLEEEIKTITEQGKTLKAKVAEIEVSIVGIGVIEFDEDSYNDLTKEVNTKSVEMKVKQTEELRLMEVVQSLIDGGICKSCNRQLDNVDNSAHIKEHEITIAKLGQEVNWAANRFDYLSNQIIELNKTKKLIDDKAKLELNRDRLQVEMDSLRNKIKSKMNDFKQYNLNLEAIDFNRNKDAEVAIVKTKIIVVETTKDNTTTNIERVRTDIQNHKNNIDTKTNLITQIKREDEVEKVFKTYIELVGKKGISKLVLRSVLPIANSEITRLLDDVCDFEVEIFMDDKNDVQYNIIEDGVSKALKSASGYEKTAASLALRAVLGKISTLPMPNFITFDEVLGKVANINLEKIKPLFERLTGMYDIVFLITHNELVKDWSTNIITVKKNAHISTLN